MSDEMIDDIRIENLETEAAADILEQEAEATPEQEAANVANTVSSTDGYQEGDGLAPFAGAEHDPGMEGLEEETEEAQAPEPIVYRDLAGSELQAAVEATLFMHHKPISVARIRELINPGIEEEEYRSAVSNLMATYFDENRGIELVEVANGFQLRTKAENKDIIRRMYQIAPTKLTNAMLEVLAIVAYNQPLTREGVDTIRGVDSSHLLRCLLDKKMLRIVGKSDTVGNPMIYGTTKEFLELFGLRDLSALPSLRELEEMLPKSEVGSISEEEALSQEMEGIVTASRPVDFNDLELEGWNEEDEKRELLGADEGGQKGPSWRERLKIKKAEKTADETATEIAAAQAVNHAAAPDGASNTAAQEAASNTAAQEAASNTVEMTENATAELAAQETEPSHEQPQKIEIPQTADAGENRDGRAPGDGSATAGFEAGGDADLPPEIARRITPGQEGHA